MTAAWLYDEPSVANTPAASARRGALVVVPRLSALPAALDSALKPQLTALGLVGPGPGCLHIAIAGELDTLIGPGLGALGSQLNPLAEDPPSPVELSITGSSNVGEVDGAAVGAAAVRQALAGAFSSCSSSLYSLGFDILSAVVNTGSSAVPLRVGYRWCPERGDRGSEKLTVTSSGNFRRDRFLQQVREEASAWHSILQVAETPLDQKLPEISPTVSPDCEPLTLAVLTTLPLPSSCRL
jgi:hypothetical protein